MIYLDYSATTPVNPDVLDSLLNVSRDYIGNPNSMHSLGVKSRALLKSATRQIADCLNIKMEEIIYTSGATEANNTALLGVALRYKNRGNHIILSKLEHPSEYVLANYLENLGFRISYVNNDSDGLIDLDDLKSLITDKTILVSIVGVNSEVGVRQPLKTIRQIIKKENPNTIFHSDLTQGLGKVAINLNDVDLASFSGHKIYGPKGIGFLYIKKGTPLMNLLDGGAQESGHRGGTENVASIVGMATALRFNVDNMQKHTSHLEQLQKIFIKGLDEHGVDYVLNGSEHRIPGSFSVSFPHKEGEAILHRLDLMGVAVTTGSACNSKETEVSHVLKAIALPENLALGTVRFTFGFDNTEDEVRYVANCLAKIMA